MFVLGHIGLTMGIIIGILLLLKKTELLKELDFRLIILIALIPDIIDKLIGNVILQESLNNGRLFSHTLAFLITFSLIFYFIIKSKWWIYSIAIIMHQVLDRMFIEYETWFWPVFGWEFKIKYLNVWDQWLEALISDPYIITGELGGIIVIIIVIFQFKLYNKNKLENLLKTGNLLKYNEN
jgi:membrane-bound metal-dependent hydrolase YbcI (DUF457 family)